MGDPRDIDLAILFARSHGKGDFVFWRAPDWHMTHGVTLKRTSPETVRVTTRPIGRGTLARP